MAKKKKEQEFRYLMTSLPQEVDTYGQVKVNFSGMNLRHTMNTGSFSMESNISTKEAPCLTPSPAMEIMKDGDKVMEQYAYPLSMHIFGNMMAVMYADGKDIKIDYFETDGVYIIGDVYTGVMEGANLENEDIPRTMIQFNTYSNVTDSVTGKYQNTLIVLPDRKSMPFKIQTTMTDLGNMKEEEKKEKIAELDLDCMYYYAAEERYYVYNKSTGNFVWSGGTGYFLLSDLYVDVLTYYNDGYVLLPEVKTYDAGKVYYVRTSTERPYKYEEFTDFKESNGNIVMPSDVKLYENSYDYRPTGDDLKTDRYYRNLYNDYVYRYEDSKRFDPETGDTVEEEGWYIAMNPSMPDLHYAVVHQSRVFGVNDTHVFASCFNNYAAWQLDTVDDINEANAWSSAAGANTKASGEFRGMALYENHVVCFKENFMHEIYNTKNPFRIQDIYEVGTIDHRSIAIAGGMLIFVSKEAVYVYTGGRPRDIGNPLGVDRFRSAVAGSDDRFYYLFCTDEANKKRFFVYDTEVGQWSERAVSSDIVSFAQGNEGMYALCSDGYVYRIDGTEYAGVKWAAETDLSTLLDGSPTANIKHLRKIQMTVQAEDGANFKVYALYDNKEFGENSHLLYDSNGRNGLFPVRVKPRMTANFALKLRICGTGYVKVYGMEIYTTAGGELFVTGKEH